MKAAATHRVVVFGAIEGTANPARATRELDRAGSRVKGVQTGSVRTSSAPAAFSFVLDPHSQSPDQAVRELQRRLAPTGVKLALIRVLP
jgi:chloramphenicol 3-O-phosphotransferase